MFKISGKFFTDVHLWKTQLSNLSSTEVHLHRVLSVSLNEKFKSGYGLKRDESIHLSVSPTFTGALNLLIATWMLFF